MRDSDRMTLEELKTRHGVYLPECHSTFHFRTLTWWPQDSVCSTLWTNQTRQKKDEKNGRFMRKFDSCFWHGVRFSEPSQVVHGKQPHIVQPILTTSCEPCAELNSITCYAASKSWLEYYDVVAVVRRDRTRKRQWDEVKNNKRRSIGGTPRPFFWSSTEPWKGFKHWLIVRVQVLDRALTSFQVLHAC